MTVFGKVRFLHAALVAWWRSTRLLAAIKTGKAVDMVSLITGVIRAVLACVATFFVNQGWIDSESIEAAATALVAFLIALWSVIEKWQGRKKA